MTDPRSDHLRDDELAYDVDWEPESDDHADDEEALPARPRRRLLTPAFGALLAVLVGAAGFIAGVEVQKGQDDGATTSSPAGFAAARGGGGGAGSGGPGQGQRQGTGGFGQQSNTTVGSVVNKNGSTLYVKDSDGTTVRVKTSSHSKVNRTASTSAGAIHPGDTVIVQGTKSANGTVTATQVNATSSSAAGSLTGLFRGGLGGGGGSGFGGGAAQGGGQGGSPQGGGQGGSPQGAPDGG
jgi:hypothetical protein